MITNNITVLLHGGHTVNATNVLIYEASLCVCCIIMYLVLHYLSRNYSSMIIKSELYLWKVDIVSTLGISVAFLFQIFLTHSPINLLFPYHRFFCGNYCCTIPCKRADCADYQKLKGIGFILA